MSKSTLISIITINYNNKVGLEKTIKSIINQTSKCFDYIVIDGNSNDGSTDLLEEYKNEITYSISEPDNGIYNAMNKAIEKAKGKYLLFINSGDELLNDTIIQSIEKDIHTSDLISFNIEVIEAENSYIKTYPSEITLSYLFKDTLPHPATFIKKELFSKVGLYDETMKIVSDWKFFILALVKYNASYQYYNKVLSKFYFDGISSKPENIAQVELEKKSVFDNEFKACIKDIEEINHLRNTLSELKKSKKITWLQKLNLLNKF